MMRCELLRRARDTTRVRAARLLAATLAVAIIFTTSGIAHAASSESGVISWYDNVGGGDVGVVMANGNKYSAAVALIDRSMDDVTPDVRQWLVSPTHGGRFYTLAQSIEQYDAGRYYNWLAPEFMEAAAIMYGTPLYIWRGRTSVLDGAREDFDKILAGDFDPSGGGASGEIDTLVFKGNLRAMNNQTGANQPAKFLYSGGSTGTKYTTYLWRTESGGELQGSGNLLDEEYTVTIKNETNHKWYSNKKYALKVDTYNRTNGEVMVQLLGIDDDKEFTIEYGTNNKPDNGYTGQYVGRIDTDGTSEYERFQAKDNGTQNVSSYLCNKSSLTYTMTDCAYDNRTGSTSLATTSAQISMVLLQDSSSAPEPPASDPTDWPDDDPTPTPEPPEVPAPTTPIDPDPYPDPPQNPIIPNPEPQPDPPVTTPTPTPSTDPVAPTQWTDYVPWLRAILSQLAVIHTDMMTGINSVIAGINNISTMISRVITALNDHCAHIRNTITESVDSVNDTNTYLWRYVWGEGGRFSYYQDNLMRYLQQLFEWLADQFDFTFNYDGPAAYDDSSVISWLKKIWAKLGGGTINTEPKDPVTNNDDWWQWLRDAFDGFFGGLVDILEDLGTGLGTFGDFLRHTFPFSIPWDLALLLGMLVAEPVTPSLTLTMPAIDGWWDSVDFVLDLEPYDDMMEIIRQMELFCFTFYLAMKTPELLRDTDVAGWLKGGE